MIQNEGDSFVCYLEESGEAHEVDDPSKLCVNSMTVNLCDDTASDH